MKNINTDFIIPSYSFLVSINEYEKKMTKRNMYPPEYVLILF